VSSQPKKVKHYRDLAFDFIKQERDSLTLCLLQMNDQINDQTSFNDKDHEPCRNPGGNSPHDIYSFLLDTKTRPDRDSFNHRAYFILCHILKYKKIYYIYILYYTSYWYKYLRPCTLCILHLGIY
jgi:hypothetical protein